MKKDLPLYHPSFFLSGLKVTPLHFQTDPLAYLECLSYSAGKEEVIQRLHGVDQNFFLKQISAQTSFFANFFTNFNVLFNCCGLHLSPIFVTIWNLLPMNIQATKMYSGY